MEVTDPEEEFVLRCHLKDLNMTEEAWTGYVDSEEKLSELERDLLKIGVSFKTHGHEKNRGGRARLRFCTLSAVIPISSNVPFRVLSIVHKGCLFGKDRHNTLDHAAQKAAQAMAQGSPAPDMNVNTFTKRKRKIQASKKKGCTAVMQIKCVQLYPDFKVDADADSTRYKVRKLKETALRNLTEAMSRYTEEALLSEIRFYVYMTRKCKHTGHDFVVQPMQSPLQASHSTNRKNPRRGLGTSKARLQNATNRLNNEAAYCHDQEALDTACGHVIVAPDVLLPHQEALDTACGHVIVTPDMLPHQEALDTACGHVIVGPDVLLPHQEALDTACSYVIVAPDVLLPHQEALDTACGHVIVAPDVLSASTLLIGGPHQKVVPIIQRNGHLPDHVYANESASLLDKEL